MTAFAWGLLFGALGLAFPFIVMAAREAARRRRLARQAHAEITERISMTRVKRPPGSGWRGKQ